MAGRMRVALTLALLTIVACAPPLPPASTIPPSTPPPPPPEREVNAVTVHGRVVTSRGMPAAFASVLIRAADASCRPLGVSVGAVTDENGQYQGVIDVGVGPAMSGCVVVEARSGGASGSASAPAWFTSSVDLRQPVTVDLTLGRPSALTLAEAERLVEWLARAINDRSGNVDPELGLYVADGSEALRVALEQYRIVLDRVVEVRTGHHGASALRTDCRLTPHATNTASGSAASEQPRGEGELRERA